MLPSAGRWPRAGSDAPAQPPQLWSIQSPIASEALVTLSEPRMVPASASDLPCAAFAPSPSTWNSACRSAGILPPKPPMAPVRPPASKVPLPPPVRAGASPNRRSHTRTRHPGSRNLTAAHRPRRQRHPHSSSARMRGGLLRLSLEEPNTDGTVGPLHPETTAAAAMARTTAVTPTLRMRLRTDMVAPGSLRSGGSRLITGEDRSASDTHLRLPADSCRGSPPVRRDQHTRCAPIG